MVRLAIAILLVLTATARADKLADARQAIDEVRYDDARRLLVEAIDAGGNSAAAMRQIYELSASTAIVLDQRDLGEQYYRRWLAIDPAAKLPAGSSPKLTDAFVAAQAYMSAHGRLVVTASRAGPPPYHIDVAVQSDPLSMAASAVSTATPVPFGADHHARLDDDPNRLKVAILDERGNELIELDVAAVEVVSTISPPGGLQPVDLPRPSFAGRWTTWAVPSGACLIAGAILGGLAIAKQNELDNKLADSGMHTFTEIQHDHDTIRRNGTIAIGLAAGATVLAIPAVVLYLRQQHPSKLGTAPIQFGPTGPMSLGVSGRF